MLLPNAFEVVLVLVHLLVVGLTAALAHRRGRSPWFWGLLALVISIWAAAVLLVLPRREAALA